jgi:SAM-dependent methyltransferase
MTAESEHTARRDSIDVNTQSALIAIRSHELNRVRDLFAPAHHLLELGGGNGYQARELSRLSLQVESVDIDPDGIWRERYFPVKRFDGYHLPFGDATFDIVFSSNVLEHVPDVERLLVDARRVMKPDGIAVHVVPSSAWRVATLLTHYPWLLQRAWRRLMADRSRSDSPSSVGGGAAPASRSLLSRLLVAAPHGTAPNALVEVQQFSRAHWHRRFESVGYLVERCYVSGLFYTGHLLSPGLSLAVRERLAKVFGSACHVFVLRTPRGDRLIDPR